MATVEESTAVAESTGGEGGLLESRRKRGDARLIARMLSLGVVSPSRVRDLLRKGFDLAESCAGDGDARGYSACMKIVLTAAKLGQDERKQAGPASTTNIQINDCNFTTNDPRAELLGILAAASERARAAESSGIADTTADPEPGVPTESTD